MDAFSRMEETPSRPGPRKRASTLKDAGIPSVPDARQLEVNPDLGGKEHAADVFESREDEEREREVGEDPPGADLQLPSTFDELPIEIRSLTERFLDSLSAKVHPQPFTVDALAALFQDFYERAESHIATHIASLISKVGRDKSPAPSKSLKTSLKGRPRAGSGAKRSESSSSLGGEMLTVSEVADRKKARRVLELQRIALEEAVERVVTERVYERIWKHRSTDDDARDEKLRSRTAALSLIGIGLKELHMDSDGSKEGVRKATEDKAQEIYQSLSTAREALENMDNEHYPLGKLRHLTEAHKGIVETLSKFFPSSSSADEILPTLIYTLITCPPEGVNVVSNLSFVQRFRASSKVDGEAAYCLVNLEAAISFLETVDLSSLRAEELPEGPPKSQVTPSTPASEKPAINLMEASPVRASFPEVTNVALTPDDDGSNSTGATVPLPSPKTPTTPSRPTMHQRRLSSLMQAQAGKIEAGREGFLNAADKIYDSINGTLENSLQFVFGRFKDQAKDDSPLPKTLEDARKLVNSPNLGADEDSFSNSGRSSPALDDPLSALGGVKTEKKMLELIGGRKQVRDRSVDSERSGGSGGNSGGRRVAFNESSAFSKEKTKEEPPVTSSTNLFATINPLNHFQVPSFPRFGRAGTAPSPSSVGSPSPSNKEINSKLSEIVESPASIRDSGSSLFPADGNSLTAKSSSEDLSARETLAELRKLKPPKKRFLDVAGAGELKIAEVEELLLEYRRLAKAIGEAIAS